MRSVLILLLLAGCAAQAPQTITVKEAVPVPCDVRVPVRPMFADEMLTGDEDIFQMVRALWSGRLARKAYEQELEITLRGCVGDGADK